VRKIWGGGGGLKIEPEPKGGRGEKNREKLRNNWSKRDRNPCRSAREFVVKKRKKLLKMSQE